MRGRDVRLGEAALDIALGTGATATCSGAALPTAPSSSTGLPTMGRAGRARLLAYHAITRLLCDARMMAVVDGTVVLNRFVAARHLFRQGGSYLVLAPGDSTEGDPGGLTLNTTGGWSDLYSGASNN